MPDMTTCAALNVPAQDVPVLRLGVVPYLNVQPLIWKFRQTDSPGPEILLQSALPRLLAEELRAGKHDAAIVPIFEHFLNPARYVIVPGMAIGCTGPVRSVMLYSNCTLKQMRNVHLDPASLTSVNLLKVLLGEMGLHVEYQTDTDAADETLSLDGGRLLIGDPALQAEGRYPFAYDLGQMWKDLTGLPFVFAAWLARIGSNNDTLFTVLQEAARWGTANVERVATECAGQFGVSPDFAVDYFRASISYELGPTEMQAIEHFRTLCIKNGLAANR